MDGTAFKPTPQAAPGGLPGTSGDRRRVRIDHVGVCSATRSRDGGWVCCIAASVRALAYLLTVAPVVAMTVITAEDAQPALPAWMSQRLLLELQPGQPEPGRVTSAGVGNPFFFVHSWPAQPGFRALDDTFDEATPCHAFGPSDRPSMRSANFWSSSLPLRRRRNARPTPPADR